MPRCSLLLLLPLPLLIRVHAVCGGNLDGAVGCWS
jgi:hypothetical protein